MSEDFFKRPILNSPYEYPSRHWELDENHQPTEKIVDSRRRVDFITPIPEPKKRKGPKQKAFVMDEGMDLSDEKQQYAHTATINNLRTRVDEWRKIKDPSKWGVTPETARLLQHWRHHEFSGVRPFFCQIEAVETAIWLTEVAPNLGKVGRDFLDHLDRSNKAANPELSRMALKLATGAGKTTVMAMLIAWQTINAVRRKSDKFSRGFLIVAPGITIKDRLRVLQPNDPENYYFTRELVPPEFAEEIKRAKIVITNYHAFKLREKWELSKGTRDLLQGRGEDLMTLETEGQMLQRVMSELMSMKKIIVLNDEAHHCYREKPGEPDESLDDVAAEDRRAAKEEAKNNKEAARLWITGLETVQKHLGISRVIDLSATPFFLSGSGYREGTLFPWTMSDFSLMDAIESGIVKLPRVPVSDNIPGGEVPMYRYLWDHIRTAMPKKGRSSGQVLDPQSLPTRLQNALEALYGHYKETFEVWQEAGIKVPPCFIVVCNNTATSKLVYDLISGYYRKDEEGVETFVPGRFELFENLHREHGTPHERPRTILVDSTQLESGEALDDEFRTVASDEIERFRREIVERTGNQKAADEISDADLLREVMNTVGKPGKLGESIRCVVSVAMLTEGWDANTVTHILGVRAFGTQLICEQVIGRALRRQAYDLNEEGVFNVEYADILGVPFDFAAQTVPVTVVKPRNTVHVKAMRPERDALEIEFPRVQGYRVELPEERLTAEYNDDSILDLTPDLVGPSIVRNVGIVGEGVDLDLKHLDEMRASTVLMHLTKRLMSTKFRDNGGDIQYHLFGQLKRVTKQWLDNCLVCKGGTYPAQLMYQDIADLACERITAGITRAWIGERPVRAILDPYNPTGSTRYVSFNTSREDRWETDSRKSHINWVVLDSGWEGEFCRIAEAHPRVVSYAKNHNLGLEVPYQFGSESRKYWPDYILRIDDGRGEEDLLNLIVEVKGYQRESAKDKKSAIETYWVPGVNNLGTYGRWAFAEFTDVWTMEMDFKEVVEREFEKMIDGLGTVTAGARG